MSSRLGHLDAVFLSINYVSAFAYSSILCYENLTWIFVDINLGNFKLTCACRGFSTPCSIIVACTIRISDQFVSIYTAVVGCFTWSIAFSSDSTVVRCGKQSASNDYQQEINNYLPRHNNYCSLEDHTNVTTYVCKLVLQRTRCSHLSISCMPPQQVCILYHTHNELQSQEFCLSPPHVHSLGR